jgi:putative Mg2+ transporter-C (MgtC) family protein
LERASYPVGEIEVSERSEDVTELAAILVSTAIHPAEMDAVIAAIEASPLISYASWSPSAAD